MKVTLTFDDDEERYALRAMQVEEYRLALWELDQWLAQKQAQEERDGRIEAANAYELASVKLGYFLAREPLTIEGE